MRLIVTGGGTGGHVYPALEVARAARDAGHEVLYFGSLRGQEGAICEREGLPFVGFPSQPLYSLKTPRGWKAAASIYRSRWMARAALRAARPNVLFSTGGYSAGPVVAAAQGMRLPYVLHEANSAPGRSNLLFAKRAFAIGTVFRGAADHFKGCRVVRTGMPIRRELREQAPKSPIVRTTKMVLVTGGSQGSAFLNDTVPQAAQRVLNAAENLCVSFVHVAGKGHIDEPWVAGARTEKYRVVPFFEGNEMAESYADASLIVSRSGGSLAEVAMFGIPSVLIPLPTAAADHQTANAREFVGMNAATLIAQSDASPEALADAISYWLENEEARKMAFDALKLFDVPNATELILGLLNEAAR